MLVRVDVENLLVGMYVDSLDLSWYDHPFWRRRFALRTQEDVNKLKNSGARSVVIDSSKGIGLPSRPAESKADDKDFFRQPVSKHFSYSSVRPTVRPFSGRADRLSGQARSVEIRHASKILNRSKEAVMRMFGDARMGKAIEAKQVGTLVEQIAESVAKDPSIILNVARLKSKDEYTFLHSVSVCALMINLSRKLGLDEAVVREMGMAGMLHDVGKMAIPDAILNKSARLNDEEMDVVRNHPQRGFEILSTSESIDSLALDVCLSHHEKMDGTGYPNRIRGEELSLAARMAAICDVYDAITSQRSYNQPWTAAEALQKMQSWKGHFDQLLLKSFIESLGIWPIGTVVRLSDETLAIIIGEDPNDFSQPVVRAFFSVEQNDVIRWRDIHISELAHTPKIMSQADPLDFGIKDWSVLSTRLLANQELAVP